MSETYSSVLTDGYIVYIVSHHIVCDSLPYGRQSTLNNTFLVQCNLPNVRYSIFQSTCASCVHTDCINPVLIYVINTSTGSSMLIR